MSTPVWKLPNDDARKILFVAVSLCLVCSLLVSAAAVLLGPIQQAQRDANRKLNVLMAAGLAGEEDRQRVEALFGQVEAHMVDLRSGQYTDELDLAGFDSKAAARNPDLSAALDRKDDIAGIGRRSHFAPVYLVRDGEEIERVILPIHGYGLWSTMYAFLALEGDLNTVASINFYEHAETPGLGGEVENPRWRASWEGKLVYGEDGQPHLRVIKGSVDPDSADAAWQVDGLSGATLTGNGVSNMVRYWLGPQGYGPYLENLRTGGA